MGRRQKKRQAADAPLDRAAVLGVFRKSQHPLSEAEVLRALRLPRQDREALGTVLAELVQLGRLIRIGGAYGLTDRMHLVTGRLEVQRSGAAFVVPEDPRRKDLFIPPGESGDAWHSDRVVAAVVRERRGRSNEGRIVRVLARGRQILPAVMLKRTGPGLYLCRPTDPRLGFKLLVQAGAGDPELASGDVALVAPGERVDPLLWEAALTRRLGPESEVPVQEALVKANHGIPTAFPDQVLAEASRLPESPSEADFRGREDLRALPLVTIDGATARDFDDAVCVEETRGGFRLYVAIADVAHYVPEGSELDREAFSRGNSYYFPQSVEPMFPQRLSNGLCSLNPGVPRLAMAVRLDFSANGAVRGRKLFPAVIRSHARLTYSQVRQAVIDRDPAEGGRITREAPDVLPMLFIAERLARELKRRRSARGSLDFDLPEAEILFDAEGGASDIRPKARHFGHQIIEEFMIAANEAVAGFLEEQDLPCLFRVHPAPDQDKLRALFDLLARTEPEGRRALFAKKDFEPEPADLQRLIADVAGTDKEFLVNRLLLRSMMQARYDPENEGHFGLASECYCHFTSPIRRFADLVVHRMVKAALRPGAAALPGGKRLAKAAEHLSRQERIAMEAEREILKRVTCLFLRDQVGRTFRGVVCSLTDYGFWVELVEVLAEGLVRLSTLHDDYYSYLRESELILGSRTGRMFRLGQTVGVRLIDVSLDRLEVTLAVEDAAASGQDQPAAAAEPCSPGRQQRPPRARQERPAKGKGPGRRR